MGLGTMMRLTTACYLGDIVVCVCVWVYGRVGMANGCEGAGKGAQLAQVHGGANLGRLLRPCHAWKDREVQAGEGICQCGG